MATLFSLDNKLINANHLQEAMAVGDFTDLTPRRGATSVIQESIGNNDSEAALVPFKPIGIGKPVSIEILTIYTGDAPKKFLGGKPDLLVVSGVRSVETHGAAPKAINHIVKNIKDYQYIEPSAMNQGSPIVYYSPAITSGNTLCSFHMVVDTFDDSTIKAVSEQLKTAAGIPLFAPASAYLLAGSSLLNIGADIGKAFEKGPYLEEDISLNFLVPGMPPLEAQAMILTNDRDEEEFLDYKIGLVGLDQGDKMMALVHKRTGKKYMGDAPYMIVVIDGRQRTELKDFAPKLATTAILDKFYPKSSISGKVIDQLENAMQLTNDLYFRKKADNAKKQLAKYSVDTEQYQNTKILLDAYLNNIQNDYFKPPMDGSNLPSDENQLSE